MANLIHSNQILYPLSGSFVGSFTGSFSGSVIGAGGVFQTSSLSNFPTVGDPAILYVDQSTKLTYYYSGSGYVGVGTFNNNITVNLSGGKTLGKYTTGQTIPAKGLTPEQMFNLVAQEAINPTVTLTTPTTILYNQPTTNNAITASYTINSLGATIVSASLYWRYNNTGNYTLLTSSTSTPLYYNHALTLTTATTSINYLYAVTESSPASSSATANITIGTYQTPTVSVTANYISLLSGESNTSREYGNVSSSITASIKGNNVYSDLSAYQLQISTNGGSTWSYLTGSTLPAGTGTSTIYYTDYSAASTAASIIYRAAVTGSNGTINTTNSSTITFYYRNYLAANSTIISSNATAQTVVTSAFSSSLSTTRVWSPYCVPASDILGNYTYIIYPSSYGNLADIKQNGALSILGAFTNLGTYTVTGSYGASLSTLVYKSNSDKAFASGVQLVIT